MLNSDYNYTYYSDIIETKIPKYLDMICSKFLLDQTIEEFFIIYAHNKHIDVIVEKSTNIKTHLQILNFFGTKYYNKSYEIMHKKYGDCFETRMLNLKIIEEKSKKYIENFINDSMYHAKIASTGIDKYLDYLIKVSKDDEVMVEIAGIGRKKDLDYFLKNISKFKAKNNLLTKIAYFGNDNHLDSPELIKSNDYCVYYKLFEHERIKDLNKMKNNDEYLCHFDFDSVKFPW